MTQELIAITGASGFVGRAVLALAQKQGVRVRALMRSPQDAGCEVVAGSLEDADALARLCEGASAVIHIAGAIQAKNRKQFMEVNARGAARAAQAAREAGVARFVHVSSLAAREPELSAYAFSKRAGELEVAAAAGEMDWVALRPPAVYGPGDKATLPLFQQLTRRFAFLPARADARVSLLHVDDLAATLLRAAGKGFKPGLVHEIDDGHGGYSWDEICAVSGASPVFLPRALLAAVAGVSQVAAGVSGRATMVNLGKVAELYHPDWVARGKPPSFHRPKTQFAAGFAGTLAAYRQLGWLRGGGGEATKPPMVNKEASRR